MPTNALDWYSEGAFQHGNPTQNTESKSELAQNLVRVPEPNFQASGQIFRVKLRSDRNFVPRNLVANPRNNGLFSIQIPGQLAMLDKNSVIFVEQVGLLANSPLAFPVNAAGLEPFISFQLRSDNIQSGSGSFESGQSPEPASAVPPNQLVPVKRIDDDTNILLDLGDLPITTSTGHGAPAVANMDRISFINPVARNGLGVQISNRSMLVNNQIHLALTDQDGNAFVLPNTDVLYVGLAIFSPSKGNSGM